jgi:lipoprotein-releasing system permease protein
VTLGVAALTIVVSVTSGFIGEFQDKVLGVNAHVLVLKYSSDFREYRKVMKTVETVPGVKGVAPFYINPMMVTHGRYTATGVLLKGIEPDSVGRVLDLPKHIVQGSLVGLRPANSAPPERRSDPFAESLSSLGVTGTKANEATIVGATSKPIASEKAADKSRAAKTFAEQTDLSAGAKSTEVIPEGNVEPVDGYRSVLPDDDIIPDDIISDPCRSPEARLKLPGIVVGKTLRDNLHLALGDCMQVTFPTVGFSYSGGVIRAPVAKQFRVIAVFDAGFDQYDSKLVYTDLYQAQAFNDGGDTVTGIEMKLDDINKSKTIAKEIERRLDDGIYHTMDWEELNHGLFTALRIQQILISLVLALIIIVAAFTVIATLIMVVLEKKREIAVIKAMGATDLAVMRVFLYQGSFIGLVGTGLGLLVGWAVCTGLVRYEFPLDAGVYFISRLPVRMDPVEFTMVGLFAVLVCLFATAWPAAYAARLRPADAFRSQD